MGGLSWIPMGLGRRSGLSCCVKSLYESKHSLIPNSGIGQGSWENGVWDYRALPKAGAKETIDKKTGASWSYDDNSRVMISYDTKEVSREKVEYIRKHGLGG